MPHLRTYFDSEKKRYPTNKPMAHAFNEDYDIATLDSNSDEFG